MKSVENKRIKTLIVLLEKYTNKKVVLTEINKPDTADLTYNLIIRLLKMTKIKMETKVTRIGNIVKVTKLDPETNLDIPLQQIEIQLDKYGFRKVRRVKVIKGENYTQMINDLNIVILLPYYK